MKNNEEYQIFTWRNPSKITPEVNDKPSLTDESFFEPLPVLIEKILRGESTTLGDSTATFFEYDGNDEVDFDGHETGYVMDDLTDIDYAKAVFSKKPDSLNPVSDANSQEQASKQTPSDATNLADDRGENKLGGEGA